VTLIRAHRRIYDAVLFDLSSRSAGELIILHIYVLNGIDSVVGGGFCGVPG